MNVGIIGDGSGGVVFYVDENMVMKICYNKPPQFLLTLDHPNLVKCFDITTCDDMYKLTMAYVGDNHLNDKNGNDLFSYLSVTTKVLCPGMVIDPLLDVIDYLHDKRITHNDIKEENICIDKTHHITLIDIEGMMQHESYDVTITQAQFIGTYPPFMFPMNPFDYDIKCIGHVLMALNSVDGNDTNYKVALMMLHGLFNISYYKCCWKAHKWSCLVNQIRCSAYTSIE